ncbi:hypothetical protein ES702_01447 [subsurface metagenome]
MPPKAKIDPEKFEATALKLKTLDNAPIARSMGVDRVTIWRFKGNNPDVVKEVLKKLQGVKTVRFDATYVSIDAFRELPIIQKWRELQLRRPKRPNDEVIHNRLNAFFNVCRYLKLSPNRITPELASTLIMKVREYEGRHLQDAPPEYRGLSYYTVRKPVRSFFQLVHGVSGERLTALGIDAGRSKGTGSMAGHRVTQEQRSLFIKSIPDAINWVEEHSSELKGLKRIDWDYNDKIMIELELKGIAYFMYYTATRITASHNIMLNDTNHKINPEMWRIHVLDKGRGGGIHWQKRLMDDGIIKLQEYINTRFEIPIDEIKDTIPDMNEYLFPWTHSNTKNETAIMKRALIIAGNEAIQPNHIWRHTFAQDSLKATNYNYELCAEIGGWKNTDTMKLSYGEIDEETIETGLRKIMGLPVIEKEPRFLKW